MISRRSSAGSELKDPFGGGGGGGEGGGAPAAADMAVGTGGPWIVVDVPQSAWSFEG